MQCYIKHFNWTNVNSVSYAWREGTCWAGIMILCTYRSLSIIVFNLWAMVRIVQSANSVRIVLWISSSVSRSTAAVASSRMRIFVLRSSVLARQTSCLWPTLKNATLFQFENNNTNYNLVASCPHKYKLTHLFKNSSK